MTTLIGVSCKIAEVPKVEGTIIKRAFYEGTFSDTYRMMVRGDDGHTRIYTIRGGSAGEFDFRYDVGSRINLPTQREIKSLIIRTSDKDLLDKINKIEIIE